MYLTQDLRTTVTDFDEGVQGWGRVGMSCHQCPDHIASRREGDEGEGAPIAVVTGITLSRRRG